MSLSKHLSTEMAETYGEFSKQLSTERGQQMAALMATIAMIALIAGPALFTGQPLLIAVGVLLAAAVLLGTRRAAALSRRH
ncbi:hypothetical protein Areg01_80980 [Actinoplanes regularis]|nr:hypothetical protein Areg01_80980 [Actinoplanes regularis]